MFELPEGSKVREPVSIEFWKPALAGETVLGRVVSIAKSTFGRYIELEPVLLWPKDGEPQGYASLKVPINSWLEKLIQDDVLKQPIAIVFAGKKPTPAGQMRTFKVADVDETKFRSLLVMHAPDLVGVGFAAGTEPAGDAGDDDLPF